MNIDELREHALANFELLLELWRLNYKIIGKEYDIIATWRADNDFGSVRFNIDKGRGADFAGSKLTVSDYSQFGIGFTKDDFNGFSDQGQAKIGFDIIGLCQRVYNKNTYQEGRDQLISDINKIANNKGGYVNAARDAAERRKKNQAEVEKKRKAYAKDLWESCKYHKLEGSIGEKYLNNRHIFKLDPNVRFHPGIIYHATKTIHPALIFKVQETPEGPMVAVHRIYLDNSGKKAKLDNPKMVLAPTAGKGIWFGKPDSQLCIAEGPENALSLLELGCKFAVSSISSTNFHNLNIPCYVREIKLYPDPDRAGLEALERAMQAYKGRKIDYCLSENGWDVNDLLRGYNG